MAHHDPDCIFCRIARGEIPAKKVYDDGEIMAFHDINPKTSVHILLVPKRHLVSLMEAKEGDAELLGKMMVLAPRIAKENGSSGGFRVVVNNGRIGGQEVYHLHMHILGGSEPVGRRGP